MNLDARLLKAASPARKSIFGAVGAGVLVGIGAVLQAALLSKVVSAVFLQGSDLAGVWPWMIVLLVIIGIRAAAGMLSDWFAGTAAAQVKIALREMIFAGMLQPHGGGVGDYAAGDVAAVVIQGVEAVDAYFSQFLPQLALAGLLPLGVLCFVFPLDPLSGLVLLLTGPLIPFFMFLIGSNSQKLTARQFRALRRMSAFLLDSLSGLRTLKTMGRSKEQAVRLEEVSERHRQLTMEVLRVAFLSALALELLGTIGTAIIAVQVGLRLLYGHMDFERAFFLLIIAPEYYLPLRTLGLRFHASQAGVAAADQVFPLAAAAAAEEPLSELDGPSPDWPSIRFDRISVHYPRRTELALQNFSLEIRRGEICALVGESGAGKTTAAQVLMGLVMAQEGCLWVGSQPLKAISPEIWRKQVAWVPQQASLIHGSIRDVLRVAQDNLQEDALWWALEQVHLADWVTALPDRLDTSLGGEGTALSSGQRQRIALARAFLRDAPLLVLDEPTAYLDPPEEAFLEETTRRLWAGKTALVIAHRLATVYRADRIVYLERGQILETGSHSDLLRAGSAYARLVKDYGAG